MKTTGWQCDSCGTVSVAARVPSECVACDHGDFPTHSGENCRVEVAFVQEACETERVDVFPSLGWFVAILS